MKIRPLGFTVAFITLMLDFVSKQGVLACFLKENQKIEIASFFNIILTANKGISFGMFPANSPLAICLLIALALIISILLGVWIWEAESKSSSVCFGLILGGALGNVVDRFLYGAVIDFLDFHIWGYHWYTFNIADCGIVIGTVLLILQMVFTFKSKQQ